MGAAGCGGTPFLVGYTVIMSDTYIVAEGFIVAGKTSGMSVSPDEVDNIGVLVDCGRVIVERVESSVTILSEPNTYPLKGA